MWASTLSFVLLVVLAAPGQSSAFTTASHSVSASLSSSSTTRQHATQLATDTPETLPEFPNAEGYLQYLETVSDLPKGFATGTSDGTFVSVEAPSLGRLPIRATVIQLTDGPTDSWAACFTSNKVRKKERGVPLPRPWQVPTRRRSRSRWTSK